MDKDNYNKNSSLEEDATPSVNDATSSVGEQSPSEGLDRTSFIQKSSIAPSTSVNLLISKKEIENKAKEVEIPAEDTIHVSKPKLYASPFFWMPIVIAVVITILINLAIRSHFEGQTQKMIYWAMVFVGILALAIFYHIMRGRKIKESEKHTTDEYYEHHDKLRVATVEFLDETNDELEKASDIVKNEIATKHLDDDAAVKEEVEEAKEEVTEIDELQEVLEEESDQLAADEETFDEAAEDIENATEKDKPETEDVEDLDKKLEELSKKGDQAEKDISGK